MIDAYKRFPLKYQAGALFFLTAVAFLIGLSQSLNPFIIAGWTAAGLLSLHVFLTKLNSLLAFIVLFAQSGFYILGIISAGTYSADIEIFIPLDSTVLMSMVTAYGFVTVFSYSYVGYKFSRGRLWVNLMTSFLLTNIITGFLVFLQPFFYITAAIIGYLAGLGYLLLRIPRQKKRREVAKLALRTSAQKKAEQLFTSAEISFTKVEHASDLPGIHYVLHDEKGAIFVTVVAPEKTFSITNTGVLYDGTDLVPVLENNHINRTNFKNLRSEWVDVILLVLSASKNLQPVTTISISKWKQPDYALGETYILTGTGFSRYIRARNDKLKNLAKKNQNRVNVFLEKFDITS